MATGGAEVDPDTCAVCLEPYRDPKFLPCFHTFCAQCITDVSARYTGGPFPCPSCRKPTTLPPGGAASLQTNFYISKRLENKEETCKVHKKRELEFYCVRCEEIICISCKMTRHEQHETEDLHTAVQQKQAELLNDKSRLQESTEYLRKRLETTRDEQRTLQDKKKEVETKIHERHAILVAAADRARDEAMASLRSVSQGIENEVVQQLKQQEDALGKLLDLQRQVESACISGKASDVMAAVQKLKTVVGSEQAVQRMTSLKLKSDCYPVLKASVEEKAVMQQAREFMGTVTENTKQESSVHPTWQKLYTEWQLEEDLPPWLGISEESE